jgi:hypothetical protein
MTTTTGGDGDLQSSGSAVYDAMTLKPVAGFQIFLW